VTAKVCDQALASTWLAARSGATQLDHIAIEQELYVGIRQKAGPFPDIGWDRHLALGCNAHGILILTSQCKNVALGRQATKLTA
jgi:hypothetical protein